MKKFIEEYGATIWTVLAAIITIVFGVLIIFSIVSDGTEARTMRVCHIEKDIILLETSDGEVYAFTNDSGSEYKVNDICTVKFDLHKADDNTDDTIISIINNGNLEEWGN